MRGKLIFITGLGVGYVFGTRAGRERFDQMVAQARKAWESPTMQEAAGVVQAQAGRLYEQGKQAVSTQVHKIGSRPSATKAIWTPTPTRKRTGTRPFAEASSPPTPSKRPRPPRRTLPVYGQSFGGHAVGGEPEAGVGQRRR